MKKILVIAPHPDDEVLGCGGTIIKNIKAGNEVFLCIMTKGEETYYGKEVLEEKRKEVLRVANLIGIKKVFFCDFIAASLDVVPQNEINHKLKEIIEECQPNELFIPHQGDLHKDHQITFQCALIAAKPKINPFIKKIFSYEVISETEQSSPYTTPFIPNIYIDISQELAKKGEAMSLYKSELREYPHPRSLKGAEIKAIQRGNEVCLEAAETFMLIREIIK
ncbi:PIG-L family deacetylase [Candidatus Woesearchaeota archaeon]|jgi:N-acetylglucosamine malate deacetylase 1|nr:PIG-L family deacetylase [Candidatus Woesearchaeota archaeon]MBT5342933.1 PIG-L family deacetylase [Candidatus Woesearchaeota archaeon]